MSRKQKKYHFIYKTTNILTGRYYYGMHSTDDLDDGYLGSGKRLRYSIRKYGEENHCREIVEFCENRRDLVKMEKEIVTLNEIAKEKCMNLMVGGKGGFKNDEHQLKASKAAAKKTNNLRWNTDERNENLKQASKQMKKMWKCGKIKPNGAGINNSFFNKTHKEESKRLIGLKNSINQKGEKNSQYGTCWIYSLKLKENKKINKDELSFYLNKNWIKGRKVKF